MRHAHLRAGNAVSSSMPIKMSTHHLASSVMGGKMSVSLASGYSMANATSTPYTAPEAPSTPGMLL